MERRPITHPQWPFQEVATDGTWSRQVACPCCPTGRAHHRCHRCDRHGGADGTVTAKVGKDAANSIGKLKLATPRPTTRSGMRPDPTACSAPVLAIPLPNDDTAQMNDHRRCWKAQCESHRSHGGNDPDRPPVRAQMRLLQTAESNDRSAGQLLGLQG